MFNENLKRIREKKGMTQGQLAEKCGLSIAFISMLERGIRQPRLKNAVQISKALDISVEELYSGMEPEKLDYIENLIETMEKPDITIKDLQFINKYLNLTKIQRKALLSIFD